MMSFCESCDTFENDRGGATQGGLSSWVGARMIILRGGCSAVCVRMHLVPKTPINDPSEGLRSEQE